MCTCIRRCPDRGRVFDLSLRTGWLPLRMREVCLLKGNCFNLDNIVLSYNELSFHHKNSSSISSKMVFIQVYVCDLVICPVHLLRVVLLRVLESNFPGDPLSNSKDMRIPTILELRVCLSQTL